MKQTPLLMNQTSMAAYLAGRKNQTRRPVKLPPVLKRMRGDLSKAWVDGPCFSAGQYLKVPCTCDDSGEAWDDTVQRLYCPYGEPGEDGLYFKETFREFDDGDTFYRADFRHGEIPIHANDDPDKWKWQPSIFMPKRLARFHVPLLAVQVERVQDISEEDAIAEGVEAVQNEGSLHISAAYNFSLLWDSIHGKKPEYKWSASPWVWCLEFPKYNAKETT